ncbi:DNA/RNA helicase domain-containing protein [Mucilaginibacter antarcticus]|uniref:DNA/RNA helicase domain-containing protein n=1 Tax=Mucilaginibacter antarcticus TaxID=1855725 RepID=UPI00362A704A
MGAFYSNTIEGFLEEDSKSIIGSLATQSGLAGFYQLLHSQTLSWEREISVLKSSLKSAINERSEIAGFGILLEYPIARRAKRIDVVIVGNNLIIVIEFKVGQSQYLNNDKDQVLDYCLDLRDFHFESRNKIIVPVLLATDGVAIESLKPEHLDLVRELRFANAKNFTDVIIKIVEKGEDVNNSIDFKQWNDSDYAPTPTIIEAAQTLYAGKSVAEIAQSHARKKNLKQTSDAVVNAIKAAKANNEKIICFITGVPGAGKTLAGLNIAHDKAFQDHEKSLATFLSGNGPLIKVLREALSRDAYKKLKRSETSAKKKRAIG